MKLIAALVSINALYQDIKCKEMQKYISDHLETFSPLCKFSLINLFFDNKMFLFIKNIFFNVMCLCISLYN